MTALLRVDTGEIVLRMGKRGAMKYVVERISRNNIVRRHRYYIKRNSKNVWEHLPKEDFDDLYSLVEKMAKENEEFKIALQYYKEFKKMNQSKN